MLKWFVILVILYYLLIIWLMNFSNTLFQNNHNRRYTWYYLWLSYKQVFFFWIIHYIKFLISDECYIFVCTYLWVYNINEKHFFFNIIFIIKNKIKYVKNLLIFIIKIFSIFRRKLIRIFEITIIYFIFLI